MTLYEQYPSCKDCPARAHGVGFVPPEGDPSTCRYVAIGQGPGQTEAERSRPFFPTAPAGHRFGSWINKAGKPRQQFLITNIVWCWLPKLRPDQRQREPINKWGNREPTMNEAKHCWKRHLGPLLHKVPESVPMFTMGSPAMQWMLGRKDQRLLGTRNEISLEEIDGRT